MAFTVRDFHDLVDIMETQPSWRAEMRRLILTDDILNLPREIHELSVSVRELIEAGKRNDERFAQLQAELASANQRNETRFERIESDTGEIKSDVTVLKSDVAVLKSDVTVLKSDVAVLKSDVAVLKSDVAVLKTDMSVVKNDVADLKGDGLERRVRERATVYLSRFARRLQLVEIAAVARIAEDAVDQGRLSGAEAEDLKLVDVVTYGQSHEDRSELYLAGEISWVVDEHDLARALTRAALLQKATGVKTMPVVLGKTIHEAIRTQAAAQQAGWVVLPQ
ncbi:MAG: hypothetical protein R3C14_29185 [Caldilineaceae bacterium]